MRPHALIALLLASAAAQAADAPRYALRYDAAARTMQVALCLAQAAPRVRFASGGGAAAALDAFARDGGGAIERDGDDGWTAHEWRAGECLRYRAALSRLADAQRHHGRADEAATVTDPSAWLLRVAGAPAAELRIELPPGYAISAPWQPLPGDGRFRVAPTPPEWMARVAIGRFAVRTIAVGDARLHVAVLGGADADARTRLLGWLAGVGGAALSAYGHLPQPDVQVLVVPVGRGREAVAFGQSTRGQGQGLTLFVDPAQPAAAFARDWIAVHELAHLMHPYLGDRGAWLAEGLATYYQNVLRARAGLIPPAAAWAELDDGWRRGRRETRGDLPLDEASAQMDERRDFQRVYWSGAAYWLEVDLALRRAGAKRTSLDEALRRFAACCLPGDRRWPPDAFVARLDALTGSTVFTTTFARYRTRRDFPDLAPAYAALGLARDGDNVRLDDAAPDAAIRRAIMREAAQPAPGNVRNGRPPGHR
jgi:hypothetical protein